LEPLACLAPGTLTVEALRQLPILKRTDIYEHLNELNSRQLPRGHTPLTMMSTSGSTGTPIQVQSTPITGVLFRTSGLRFHLWHRRDFSASNMTIRLKEAGQPKVATNRAWAPCYATGPGFAYCATLTIPELFDGLMEHEPAYLQAYPAIIMGLIRRSAALGRKPAGLREVRTFGGVLEAELREACRDHWGVPIADNYSAMEIGVMALQCPASHNMHVQEENVMLEVVDNEGNPCRPGEVGRVLVTVLHNFATPMIRYELGDYAEVGEPCPCGRGLMTLRRIVGREMHLFTMPGGEKVTPYLRSGEFNEIAPVRQFQIIQKTRKDIEVKLATVRPLTEDEERRLLEHIRHGLHPSFNYTFVYMDEIPRSANGKFEMLRSEVTS
jgi:phenylacetate-CoA ligase